ncbi:MAG TPA: biopolymer transporter ExbD [Gammaproteobacteria bacterium]
MRKHIATVQPQDDEAEIDLTPMLDVTFIMLIFFIVTSTFIRETGIDAARPDEDQPQVVQEAGAILVIIDGGDRIWIDDRPVDVRAVRAHIERMSAENPGRPVVIQAAPNSSAQTLVSVMDASRQAGVRDISLAAPPD